MGAIHIGALPIFVSATQQTTYFAPRTETKMPYTLLRELTLPSSDFQKFTEGWS
jgi:hypothetical protein